jgi:hypothetical protein
MHTSCVSRLRLILVLILIGSASRSQPALAAPNASPYVTGGALAGEKLPLFPSQHGALPGHPGAIPAAAKAALENKDKASKSDAQDFTVQIESPEYQLYPGSVEHWRAYWMRHVNTRSKWDAQTLVKNFIAPELPGVDKSRITEYSAPIYWLSTYGSGIATGQFAAPVPVVKMAPRNPVFKLDLGELKPSLYAVRVIGAVPTAKLRQFRAPQYMTLKVNDGTNGEEHAYRMRIASTDEFYSVAEIYFHAPTARHYKAELFLDNGSAIELLVHNVTLDDVLAPVTRRAIKTRQTLSSPQDLSRTTAPVAKEVAAASAALKSLTPAQRHERDEAIWKALPPINTVGSWVNYHGPTVKTYFDAGSATQTGEEIAAQYGQWERAPGANWGRVFPTDPAAERAFIANKKLGLEYSTEDLWARKPLPDPYPFKDDGSGLFFPDADHPDKGRVLAPIADAIGPRIRDYRHTLIVNGIDNYRATGNDAFLRDAALALVRFAYQFPTYDTSNYLTPVAFMMGPHDRDLRFRQRDENSRWFDNGNPYGYMEPLHDYDMLFPFIKGNEELAKAIHTFVPWVNNSADVIKLIDMYLVQHEAERIMRYHDFTIPTAIAEAAATLGDRSVTDPWMEWLFTKTYKYPLKPLGLQDMLINGYGRDGMEYRGSSYYARTGGHSSAMVASEMDSYVASGGNPKYDVRDPQRFPKPLAQTQSEIELILAGVEYPRIGDVTGPEKPLGLFQSWAGSLEEASRLGWRWSHDSKAAYVLAHYFGRKGESDEQWAKIVNASAKSGLRRAPWLDNRSRVLANWAGILESGLQHDDFRFRRAAYLRVGLGYGHHHDDTLDLNIFAHGLPMTIDAGQRPGYSTPPDRLSRVHNTVEVDGENMRTYSWVQTLSDAEGARYLRAQAAPNNGSHLFRRQVALIDVDEGKGSQPLTPEQEKPTTKLPTGVTTPNSYTFDVFRVAGGKLHTYAFHSTTEDEFLWNAKNVAAVPHIEKPDGKNAEADYLAPFKKSGPTKFAGDTPRDAPFEATWRWPKTGTGSEQFMLRQNYDEKSPRKFVKLHLFNANDANAKGARALKADMVCEKWKYRYTNLMVQRRAKTDDLQSAFAAIIEPYAGQPFLTSTRVLPIAGNEADALRAVAVEVRTKNGRTDINFADGRPDKVRGLGSGFRVSGEYAFYSTDAEGLRQASLTGGTLLSTPRVRLNVAERERWARVVKADYVQKTLTLDRAWPAAARGEFEIGSPGRMTAYKAAGVETNKITLARGADYYRSPVEKVDEATGIVTCRLEMPLGKVNGLDRNWVASNEEQTRFWRADYLGENKFKLRGATVNKAAFGAAGVLRLWEMGAGDATRQSTFVSLRRVGAGVYALEGNAGATVSLPYRKLLVSNDGKTWRAPQAARTEAGWTTISVPANNGSAPLQIKALS